MIQRHVEVLLAHARRPGDVAVHVGAAQRAQGGLPHQAGQVCARKARTTRVPCDRIQVDVRPKGGLATQGAEDLTSSGGFWEGDIQKLCTTAPGVNGTKKKGRKKKKNKKKKKRQQLRRDNNGGSPHTPIHTLSRRPGRSIAESMMSGRFVAAITKTSPRLSSPSSSVSNWFTTRSLTPLAPAFEPLYVVASVTHAHHARQHNTCGQQNKTRGGTKPH